jgi:hypothetical protein
MKEFVGSNDEFDLEVDWLNATSPAAKRALVGTVREYVSPADLPRIDAPKTMQVSAERICNNEGIAAVVLRTGNSVAIAEAIQLLRIDGEDTVASFEEGLDDGAPWHFDADCTALSGVSGPVPNAVELNRNPKERKAP